MADTKMSAATPIDAAGAVSRGAGLGGASRRTVDNLRATTDPTVNDDTGDGYHVGSIWRRGDTAEEWCCTDATSTAAVWRPSAGQYSSPRRRSYGFTDCVIGPASSVFSDFWKADRTGTGAQVSTVAVGSLNAFGIYSLDLGTTTTGRASLWASASTPVKLGSGQARFASRFSIRTLSTGTATYTTRIGFIDSNSAESTDGCFFRYTNGVNSGKWQAVCRSNGTETATDTGVTATVNTFQRFEVTVNEAGTSVAFAIDGSTVATTATNIPTGAGRETSYGIMALKSAGTTATSGGYIDYAEVELLFTSAR